MAEEYKYYAFISYNSKDSKWGQRLQRKLEHYRIPTALCRQRGWKRKPIEPVFYAPTDIQPGPLDDELKKRLFASRNLIVICSPNSANSQWVGKEIEYFSSLGRTKNIYFVFPQAYSFFRRSPSPLCRSRFSPSPFRDRGRGRCTRRAF